MLSIFSKKVSPTPSNLKQNRTLGDLQKLSQTMSREEFEKLPEVIELALMAERFKEKFKEFYETLEKGAIQVAQMWKIWQKNKNDWFEFLGSQGWLLTDDMPISIGLSDVSGTNTEDKLEQAFSKLLDSNKFEFLDSLVHGWKNNSYAARRYSIIETSLHLYKESSAISIN